MLSQTIKNIYLARTVSPLLNTSYPLHKEDWLAYRVEGALPYDDVGAMSFYLHIPFCRHLCRFCEYTRMSLPDDMRQQRYLDVMAKDIERFLAAHPNTVLQGFDIGGGTPTALSHENFLRLMTIYADTVGRVQLTPDFEPSIEGTFLTLDNEKLEAIAQAGIHRLSLGVQTSSSIVLNAQGRNNVGADVMQRIVDQAHAAGIRKVNLDLIYGLAGQDEASRQRDLDVIRRLSPKQVTLYELRVNMLPGIRSASKEELYDAYCSYYEALIGMGYHARFGQNTFSRSDSDFGVSSYLRNRMLKGTPYRGFGISAQSMSPAGIAYNPGKNEHRLTSFLDRSTFDEEAHYALPPEELLSKYIAIAAYSGGFSLDIASNILGHDAAEHFSDELAFCLDEGLLTLDNDRVQITRKGFLHYGAVFSLFYLKHKTIKTN